MSALVWFLLAALVVLHQLDLAGGSDVLVGGVMPLPLFYHAALCVGASVVWWLVTRFAWPLDEATERDERAGP
jgi:hypothetical protein